MKTASIPSLRVSPDLRESAERVLRDGETLSSFVETAIRDEINPENLYYRVYIRTASDALVNAAGKRFPISPGMIATVDIKTGEKTVWDYLIKPLNRGREALRER